jgi:hypothetical protein
MAGIGQVMAGTWQVMAGTWQKVFREKVGGNQRVTLDRDRLVLSSDLHNRYPAVSA